MMRCPVGRSKYCKIQALRGSMHSSPLGHARLKGVLGSGYVGSRTVGREKDWVSACSAWGIHLLIGGHCLESLERDCSD